MKWKTNGTFHRLTKPEKEFLCDIMQHYLAETEEMLETATHDDIFITDAEDLLKVTGLIYTRRKLAYKLTEEFDYA